MTRQQQTQLSIFLVLFNLVFWPLVFYPQFQRFLATFQQDVNVAPQVVARQKTSSSMMQRIDYDTLRNIFEYEEATSPPPRNERTGERPPREREMNSRFSPPMSSPREGTLQLRSILNLQGKLIATLQDAVFPERMFTVVKGDTVDGYVVIEVSPDAVVLERGTQRVRLTLE
ncbi:hypothetical protein [Thermospira aquatica]|uniref:Type II secretion system protein GspC N-terminal domain-containing protein n=1 Tax=Thermospira aquatica TaxID=2828656 RepID=A0AAX3BB33_9SPIR|nr:hypothetical protein [Thermospira aquatica]URA09300.1 hypothetical protein KDW03_07300 [Thermospira aquatica]